MATGEAHPRRTDAAELVAAHHAGGEHVATGERTGTAPEQPPVAGVLTPTGRRRSDRDRARGDVAHAGLEAEKPRAGCHAGGLGLEDRRADGAQLLEQRLAGLG